MQEHVCETSPGAVCRARRTQLAQEFLSSGDARAFLAGHSAAVDRFTLETAREAGLPPACALVAVGGFGRGEMFPCSDLDLLVLLPDGHGEAVDAAVSDFVTRLWDAGITVGSVVRTRAEMIEQAQKDITVSTAFLEARFLWGSRELFDATFALWKDRLDPQTFCRAKLLEMRQRHQKMEDTPYALEPNVKESPGGLRDLQVILWCARVAGHGASWDELSARGLITREEAAHLGQCERFLQDLRIRLHLAARRHEDRLVFDLQPAVAQSAGIKAQDALDASEVLMKRYYVNAKDIVQLTAILLGSLVDRLSPNAGRAQPRPIDEDFQAAGDALDITADDVFERRPEAILRAFLVYARRRELKRLSARLLRALWHSRGRITAQFRAAPRSKALFLEILQLRYGTYHCLKNLNTWGILGRFLPPWKRIVGQMQHDLYHRFTVDQHSLKVVRNLRRCAHSSYAHEYPLASALIAEMKDPWRLTVAGLFHDIGKGLGGSHSETGEKAVREFARDFGLSPEDTEFVAFLVREHLTMSHVAQREDTADPEVVRRFARRVGTKERLDGLLLLTEADIRATSPVVWTRWKQQLIEDLYHAALRVLLSEDGGDTRDSAFARRRLRACALVESLGVAAADRDAFWKDLDIVYFLRHSPEDVAWHTREIASDPHREEPLVRARTSAAGYEVLVYCPDQKFLFARVVSFFEKNGFSVLDARIHTTQAGWALDTFLVADKRSRDETQAVIALVETGIARSLVFKPPLPEPRPGRPSRRARSFSIPALVELAPDELRRSAILQITCADRIGLLYAVATVLARHGVNLQTARIATLDERAEDIFRIEGPALRDDAACVQIEMELLALLGDGPRPARA